MDNAVDLWDKRRNKTLGADLRSGRQFAVLPVMLLPALQGACVRRRIPRRRENVDPMMS